MATALLNDPSQLANWQILGASGTLPTFAFDIDLGKKRLSFPDGALEPAGGPFDLTISNAFYVLTSVKDPKIARSKKTYSIDRRTGVYFLKDLSGVPTGGKGDIFLETGVCGTNKPKF